MRYLILLGLLLAMAGCGSEAPASGGTTVSDPAGGSTATATSGTAAETAPTATQAEPATDVPDSPSGEDPGVVGTFEKSGGIAGITTKLVVWSDGRLEYSSQGPVEGLKTGQATPEQVAAVRAALESPEFQALDDSYVPADACCDFFAYAVSSPTKTVTTQEGQQWPAPLAAAIEQLLLLENQVNAGN